MRASLPLTDLEHSLSHLRGLVLIPAFILNPGGVPPFVLWSSLIVLVYGIAYAVGTWTAWSSLSRAAT